MAHENMIHKLLATENTSKSVLSFDGMGFIGIGKYTASVIFYSNKEQFWPLVALYSQTLWRM